MSAAASALLAAALGSAAGTAPGPVDLGRCVAIAAADARLACYDALAGRTEPAATAGAARTAPATTASPAAVPAAPATVAHPAGAAAPPAVAAPGPEAFGLSEARLRPPSSGPESIQAKVAATSTDRQSRVVVRLDNGQLWALLEPDVQLDPGAPVTIKRASLGSYLLVTANRRSYRVLRTQ